MPYTKLFNSIITSSLWLEPDQTRLVWITMLALADKNGEVQASVPGLARLAGVPLDACQTALAALSAPDPHSRTKIAEGRRIVEIDGGWELINHPKYRKMASEEDKREQNANRQARHRARNAGVTGSNNKSRASNGKVTPEGHKQMQPHTQIADSDPSLPASAAGASEEGLAFAEWFRTLLDEKERLIAGWKEKWAKCYDDMIRLDKRTAGEIRAVCQWARTDDFWKTNFYAPGKLRKRNGDGALYFDVFGAKMRAEGGIGKKDNRPASVRAVDEGRHYPGPTKIRITTVGGEGVEE